MSFVLGLSAKLYINTGSYSSPTWTVINNCTDVTLSLSRATADVTTRGASGFRLQVGTLAEGTTSFEMIYDTADTNYTTLQSAFLNLTPVDMAVAFGVITTTGTQYFRASFSITKFEITQPLEDAVKASVEITPTYNTVQSPGFFHRPITSKGLPRQCKLFVIPKTVHGSSRSMSVWSKRSKPLRA